MVLSLKTTLCVTSVNNEYLKTEDLGLPFGVHPFVSRDGSYILFNGKGDIYITFKDKGEKWSNPIKLGALINTSEYNETCPSLSPDEKYIFFCRYNDLNEKSDIYWVDASIIDKLSNKFLNDRYGKELKHHHVIKSN